MRQLLLTVVLASVLHPGAAALQQSPSLKFEVASIKLWSPSCHAGDAHRDAGGTARQRNLQSHHDRRRIDCVCLRSTGLSDRRRRRLGAQRELPLLELRLARSDGRVGSNLHDCSNPHDKEGISTPEKPFRAASNGSVATADCSDGVEALARIATRQLQTMVVDKTGLTGQWRFDVYYGSDNPNLPTFEGALREQLGLRLERARGPAPFVVIESVERPTPN